MSITVDPKTGLILKMIKAVASALVGLGWATVFDSQTAAAIMLGLAGIGAVMDAIINGFSSPVAGPFVPDPPAAKYPFVVPSPDAK